MIYEIQLGEEIEKYLRTKLKHLKEEDELRPIHEKIYKGIFEPIEKAYQQVMSKPLSLSSGEVYSKIWKKDDNLKIEEASLDS